jgi:hypothetical protein
MSLSNYKEKKLLDHANNVTAWTAPTTQYLCLYKTDPTDADAGTEVDAVVDDTAYVRQAITFGAATSGIGQAVTTNAQTFAAVVYGTGAAPYTTTHGGIRDGSNAVITAGSFVVGNTYTIKVVGTTSFTSIGASANTIGVIFTATGVGTGTGTANWSGNLLDYGPLAAPILRTVGKTLIFDTGSTSSALD